VPGAAVPRRHSPLATRGIARIAQIACYPSTNPANTALVELHCRRGRGAGEGAHRRVRHGIILLGLYLSVVLLQKFREQTPAMQSLIGAGKIRAVVGGEGLPTGNVARREARLFFLRQRFEPSALSGKVFGRRRRINLLAVRVILLFIVLRHLGLEEGFVTGVSDLIENLFLWGVFFQLVLLAAGLQQGDASIEPARSVSQTKLGPRSSTSRPPSSVGAGCTEESRVADAYGHLNSCGGCPSPRAAVGIPDFATWSLRQPFRARLVSRNTGPASLDASARRGRLTKPTTCAVKAKLKPSNRFHCMQARRRQGSLCDVLPHGPS
jgi:hypothetical protein